MPQEIRFFDKPAWRQRIRLGGTRYVVKARWNTRLQNWLLSLETTDGSLVVSAPILKNHDILSGVVHEKRPEGKIVAVTPRRVNRDPNREDFSNGTFKLVYVE